MTNNQNDQRGGKRDEETSKSGDKQNGGRSQGTKTGTGTTRAGEEKSGKTQHR